MPKENKTKQSKKDKAASKANSCNNLTDHGPALGNELQATKNLLQNQFPDSDDKWIVIEEDPVTGVTLSQKSNTDSQVNCFRLVAPIAAPASKLADVLWNFRFKEWREFTGDMEKWSIVSEPNPDTRILHIINKLPWPLWSRDLALVQHRYVEDGKHYLVYMSIDHEEIPEDRSNYVRARIVHSAYVFEPVPNDPNACVFTRLAQIEPGGMIPITVINSQSKTLLSLVDKLKVYV